MTTKTLNINWVLWISWTVKYCMRITNWEDKSMDELCDGCTHAKNNVYEMLWKMIVGWLQYGYEPLHLMQHSYSEFVINKIRNI